jgi:hypothetical protein
LQPRTTLSPRRRQVVDVVYVVWLVAGCFLLITINPFFRFTLGGIYSQLFPDAAL